MGHLKEKSIYTYQVFKNSIRFTIEFKGTFMRQYEAGISPIKIVEGVGYDTEMLGQRYIDSLYRHFKKQQASLEELHESSLRSKKIQLGPTDYDTVTPKRAIRRERETVEMSRIEKILNLSWQRITSMVIKKIRRSWANLAWSARFERQTHTVGC